MLRDPFLPRTVAIEGYKSDQKGIRLQKTRLKDDEPGQGSASALAHLERRQGATNWQWEWEA